MRLIDADIIMADLNDRADYADMLIKDIREYIAEQPTVEPERKRGHWVVRNEYSMWPILCSECRGWQSSRSRFCPECGADMRGEDDG